MKTPLIILSALITILAGCTGTQEGVRITVKDFRTMTRSTLDLTSYCAELSDMARYHENPQQPPARSYPFTVPDSTLIDHMLQFP